jgi:hypothetical protein
VINKKDAICPSPRLYIFIYIYYIVYSLYILKDGELSTKYEEKVKCLLMCTGGSNTLARAMSLNSEVEIRKSVYNWATVCGSRNPCSVVLYGVQTRCEAHTFSYSVAEDSLISGFNKAGV